MARHIGVAIFLTASTTSIGFLTDALSDVPLIVDFGYTAAFALTANFFTTALLMPLMLLVIGPKTTHLPSMDEPPKGMSGRIIGWVEAFGRRHPRLINSFRRMDPGGG